jgi:hypothetical protein
MPINSHAYKNSPKIHQQERPRQTTLIGARRVVALILTSLALAGGLPAQTMPFVLPWNDAAPSVTDFSSRHAPIGPNRVAADPSDGVGLIQSDNRPARQNILRRR